MTKKRMETIDEEITSAALGWMEKQAKADKPFFLWYNSTAMHFRTHLAAKNRGKSGQDDYSDRMVTHDEQIGEILDKLDELGIADNTIVMYSTDNGPENDTWPDGANTPFHGQKDSNWEGGWRVPCFIRWPGKIEAGAILNGIALPHRHVPDAAGDRRRSGHHREAARRLQGRIHDLQRPSRRLQHGAVPDRRNRRRVRDRQSSTSATTGTSSPCGSGDWKLTFAVAACPHNEDLGRNRS